jgi:hypothetical protein
VGESPSSLLCAPKCRGRDRRPFAAARARAVCCHAATRRAEAHGFRLRSDDTKQKEAVLKHYAAFIGLDPAKDAVPPPPTPPLLHTSGSVVTVASHCRRNTGSGTSRSQ